jgi:uncharacterized protein (TIGR02145 family)
MLTENKIYIILSAGLLSMMLSISCKKIETERILKINAPEKVKMLDSITVVVRVTIADIGENNSVIPGFCWSADEDPDKNDSSETLGQISTWTTITDTISGLQPDTIYYLKAFVIEENSDISYSESKSFRTGTIINPLLSTDSVKIINFNTVRVYGSFIDEGALEIIQYGHCWSTTDNPKLVTDSMTAYNILPTDSFSSLLTNLKVRFEYYVTSYAITQYDTVYADSSIHFKIVFRPTVKTDSASVTGVSSATLYGSLKSDTGADTITQYGHCWSVEDTIPTVLLTTKTAYVTSIITGTFTSPIEDLLTDTTYYIRAYVITKYDTIYGKPTIPLQTLPAVIEPPEITTDSVVAVDTTRAYAYGTLAETGTYTLIQHGHCWSLGQNPDISSINKTTLGSKNNTGKFESLVTGLIPDTIYYFRAYATTQHDTVYGEQIEFRTPKPPPYIIDPRDMQKYIIVLIGDTWWLAENLNYHAIVGSYYYTNDSIKYHRYGRLYNWNAAMNSCPAGWHLPSDDEWKNLEEAAGMPSQEIDNTGDRGNIADDLKCEGSLNFDALLGGMRYENNKYYGVGKEGYFWTSSEEDSDNAWHRKFFQYLSVINRIYKDKSSGYSVRCAKD